MTKKKFEPLFERKATMMRCPLSNTHVLCFVLGWQGGTIHQVAQELDVSNNTILDADEATMNWLCRLAQSVRNTNEMRKAHADLNQKNQ